MTDTAYGLICIDCRVVLIEPRQTNAYTYGTTPDHDCQETP